MFLKRVCRFCVMSVFVVFMGLAFCGAGFSDGDIVSVSSYKDIDEMAFAMPLSKKIIVVDAGHGGRDPGAFSGNVKEKTINLGIALKLQTFLEQGGATVLVTRIDDEHLNEKKSRDMARRRVIANSSKADIFVSIHQNSYDDPKVHGAQVFFFNESDNSKKLAVHIQDHLREFVDPGNKLQAKSNKNYFVLKQTVMPAVLVECGFLTNYSERCKLQKEDYQEKIAWAIYLGIVDYFNEPETANEPEITAVS